MPLATCSDKLPPPQHIFFLVTTHATKLGHNNNERRPRGLRPGPSLCGLPSETQDDATFQLVGCHALEDLVDVLELAPLVMRDHLAAGSKVNSLG